MKFARNSAEQISLHSIPAAAESGTADPLLLVFGCDFLHLLSERFGE